MKALFVHPNGKDKEVKIGFSWTTLFFGFLVPLFRGDFLWMFIMILAESILGYITFGFGISIVNLFFGFMYNKIYIRKLLDQGFIPHPNHKEEVSLYTGRLSGWE
ncbi:hypothetical protein LQU94_05115 [Peptoniphilus sp. KCTC 25270]|uniref:hypothetical protein n=1 Tax=Peptoniphilus sp. KCTC 25270 TaxID=2897414 RepID=UPI001E625785|nr:hypothetical protein [Peptoniphilus sp. KCTC 25270]MCD1147489.1 hypothetical protein [Peptoniphilus sp. KCTC 25270]